MEDSELAVPVRVWWVVVTPLPVWLAPNYMEIYIQYYYKVLIKRSKTQKFRKKYNFDSNISSVQNYSIFKIESQ